MPDDSEDRRVEEKANEKIKLVGAIAALVTFFVIYFAVPVSSNKLNQFAHDAIPSAIVVLIGFPIAYFLLFKEKDNKSIINSLKIEIGKLTEMFTKTEQPTELHKATGPLTGTWCACWQYDKDKPTEYQVGSMDLRHDKESNKVDGQIYRGDKKWQLVEGEWKDGHLTSKYKSGDWELGAFYLELSDNGVNRNKLKGKWHGIVDREDKQAKMYELNFFAGRELDYNKRFCHSKVFDSAQKNEGSCIS
jgi:hypothetical protein